MPRSGSGRDRATAAAARDAREVSVAGVLRIGLAVQLGAGYLLGLWLLPAQAPAWQPVAVAVAFPGAVIAVLLALQHGVAELADPRAPPPPRLHVLRAFAAEMWCHLRLFGWRQPFACGFPEPPLARDPTRPALLLIHGYLCNRAVWKPLLDSGRLGGCNVATVDLEPVFGPIERYAQVIEAALARLRAASGAERVTLVCHSMGGLAARDYLRRCGDGAVERVITLGTPHQGTVFGRFGRGANARTYSQSSVSSRRIAVASPCGCSSSTRSICAKRLVILSLEIRT